MPEVEGAQEGLGLLEAEAKKLKAVIDEVRGCFLWKVSEWASLWGV